MIDATIQRACFDSPRLIAVLNDFKDSGAKIITVLYKSKVTSVEVASYDDDAFALLKPFSDLELRDCINALSLKNNFGDLGPDKFRIQFNLEQSELTVLSVTKPKQQPILHCTYDLSSSSL